MAQFANSSSLGRIPFGNCFAQSFLVIRLLALSQSRPVESQVFKSTCIFNIVEVFALPTCKMDYSQRLRRLETEKDTDLAALREMAQVKDLEIGTAIREVHRFQTIIVKLTQEKADLKAEEDAIHSRYQHQRDELHETEKKELRQRKENVGVQVEVFKNDTSVARKIPKAPRFTPRIRCFLQHPFSMEEHDIGECYYFLTMSNPDRVKMMVGQHRCFGCFQPSALVMHELSRCPHPRYCLMCRTPDHHQVLCAPRKVYEDALPASTD